MALAGKQSRSNQSTSNRLVREKLQKLFEAAQEQSGSQDLVERCRKLYSKSGDPDMFLTEFKTVLRYCLVYPEKMAVDRMLLFVSRFVVSLYNVAVQNGDDSDDLDIDLTTDPFPGLLLEFLFKSHGAASVDARVRCVQLLNNILSAMPENSSISDDTWTKLTDTVLCRIQDKSPQVRVQAVMTARKLQVPNDADCKIIQALTFHLNDPSSAVRRTVVSSIALNKVTIGYVLARTRDINDNVRRNAYVVLSKVKVISLTIKYRVTILERGLLDRSEMVRKCVEQYVVVNWLEGFDNDVIKLLEVLDIVGCPDVGILVLQSIFKRLPMEDIMKFLPIDEESRLIPVDRLTPESALLWRCLAHYLVKEQRDDELEMILPNLVTFCDFVRRFYSRVKSADLSSSPDEQWMEVKDKQILIHLIELAKVFDLADEMGRTGLKKLIISMLTSPRIANNMVECLVQLMVPVVPGTDAFLQELTEVISEVREPLNTVMTQMPQHEQMELELKISDLKVSLNGLREREYDAVKNKDYAEAQNLKEEILKLTEELENLTDQPTSTAQEVREEKNDPVTICKCLSILVNMIKCSGVSILTPILRGLQENFLKQCLASQDLLTQSLAIQALGQFCILDKDLAKENLFRLMFMLTESDENEIRIPALKAVFDIIQRYGMESFENLDEFRGESANASNSESKYQSIALEEEDENGKEDTLKTKNSSSKCISFLKELVDCEANDALKTTAYEGLCKLLLAGVVYSPSLLTRIIIKGFSPIIDSESEDFIRQVFMVFFPIFSSSTPRSQDMIETAFISIMRILTCSPLGTPEADINPRDVATFLIEHTKPETNKYTSNTLHIHNNLALSICHELLRDAGTYNELGMSHMYLKSLLQLDISQDSESFISQLRTFINKLEKEFVNNKSNLRLLAEFQKKTEEECQTTIQSVDNTLVTTDNNTRTTASDETFTTGGTRGSSIRSSISSVASVKKRRNTEDVKLATLIEKMEDTIICDNSDEFNTPTRVSNQAGGVIPESPEFSGQSITPTSSDPEKKKAKMSSPMRTRSSRKMSTRSTKKR